MMTLEYDMVLARPGYNEKYKTDVTWDELRRSFLLYKRIPMIVAGGDHYGPIDPNLAVGHVDAKIDDAEQVIRGKGLFYKEKFEDVPAEIQSRLAHDKFVPASLGYEPFDSMRKMDHIAIGVDSPVFKDVGFHAESTFRHEETDGINTEGKEVQEDETAKDTEIQALRAEIAELKELFQQSLKPPEPPQEETPAEGVVEVPDPVENKVSPVEEPTVSQPKPQVEPERVIKREQSATTEDVVDDMFVIEGGKVFSTPIGKPLEKKK